MGPTKSLDLGSQDYTNLDFWKEVLATKIIPVGYNVSSSDATAVGGMVVLNDVRSEVDAHVTDTPITAASLSVTADETAVIRATTDSSVTASGGSAFGKGDVVAVNGTIATNLVLSSATAFVDGGELTFSGDVQVIATNLSQIDATSQSSTTSGD